MDSGASVVVGLAVVASVDVGSNEVVEEDEAGELELSVELLVLRLGALVELELSKVVDDVVVNSEVLELVGSGGRVELEVVGAVLDSLVVFPDSELVDEELDDAEVGSGAAVVEDSASGREEEGEGGVELDVLEDREEVEGGPSLVVVEGAGSLLVASDDDVVGSALELVASVVLAGALMLSVDEVELLVLAVVDSSVVKLEELELASDDEDAAEVDEGASVVGEGAAVDSEEVVVDSRVVDEDSEMEDEDEDEDGEGESEVEAAKRRAAGESVRILYLRASAAAILINREVQIQKSKLTRIRSRCSRISKGGRIRGD